MTIVDALVSPDPLVPLFNLQALPPFVIIAVAGLVCCLALAAENGEVEPAMAAWPLLVPVPMYALTGVSPAAEID